ncbi:MAG: glycosyl hydrolase-related protein, partial [Chloroflexota bacterium]
AGGERGLALTLLRCVAYLGSGTYASTIRGGAGPHLLTPGAQCLGRHTFRYALAPHAGDWSQAGLVREANAYCASATAYPVADTPPLPVRPASATDEAAPVAAAPSLGLEESFLGIEGDGVILSACKRAEAADEHEGGCREGHLILRLYNPTSAEQPARIKLRVPITRAWQSNVLEQLAKPLAVESGAVPLTIGPKKIVTVALEAEPVAQAAS